MTEEEWLASANWQMLHKSVQQRKNYPRKVRLFSVACCRRIAYLFDEPKCGAALAVAEQFADGQETRERLEAVARIAHSVIGSGPPHDRGWARGAAWRAARTEEPGDGAWACLSAVEQAKGDVAAERLAQTVLFRDIFRCPPARKVKCNPKWLTTDVLALARGIYDERAFDRMPILADALQDAGCDNDKILAHCRGHLGAGEPGTGAPEPPPHVRGCWVVDLVLGKE